MGFGEFPIFFFFSFLSTDKMAGGRCDWEPESCGCMYVPSPQPEQHGRYIDSVPASRRVYINRTVCLSFPFVGMQWLSVGFPGLPCLAPLRLPSSAHQPDSQSHITTLMSSLHNSQSQSQSLNVTSIERQKVPPFAIYPGRRMPV